MGEHDRLSELYDRYMDRTLTPEEDRELAALLADPANQARWRELATLEGRLQESLSADEATVEAYVDAVREAGKRRKRPSVRTARGRRAALRLPLILSSVAAAAVVVAVLWVGGSERAAKRRRPVPVAVEGERSAAPAEPPAGVDTHGPDEGAGGAAVATARGRPAPDVPPAPEESRPETAADDGFGAVEQPAPRAPEPAAPVVATGPAPDAGPPAAAIAPRPPALEVHLGYLDTVEGVVETADAAGGAWRRAGAGVPLVAGRRLRTKYARARVAFQSGTSMLVNRFTIITIGKGDDAPVIELVAGEIYIETTPEDSGFTVTTPHGRAVDIGTRFGVEVKRNRTSVLVAQGTVLAATDAGEVTVRDRQETILVSRIAPPRKPRAVRDSDARLAWARPPAERHLVFSRDDFEAYKPGTKPPAWKPVRRDLPHPTVVDAHGRRCLRLEGVRYHWPIVVVSDARLRGLPTEVSAVVRCADYSQLLIVATGLAGGTCESRYKLRFVDGALVWVKHDERDVGRYRFFTKAGIVDKGEQTSLKTLAPQAAPGFAPGGWLHVRVRVVPAKESTRLLAKVWPVGKDEPAAWDRDDLDRGHVAGPASQPDGWGIQIDNGEVLVDDFTINVVRPQR